MKITLAALLLIIPFGFAAGDAKTVVAEADALHDQGGYAEAVQLLLGSAPSAAAADQAELYWRAAREALALGDVAENAGKPQTDVLAVFVEGEGYADKAIAADPKNDLGYYWKSANIGRWGQVKGVMNALMKAQPMKDLLVKELSLNPDRTDAYFVLGQLYRELPGWPVSFGDTDAAVSLGRRAVDAAAGPGRKRGGTGARLQFLDGARQDTVQAQLAVRRAVFRAEEQGRKALLGGHAAGQGLALRGDGSPEERLRPRGGARAGPGGRGRAREAPDLTATEKRDLAKAKDVLKGW